MPKSKPKILIIGTTDIKGGAASVGWHVGEAMRERGYDVKYLVGYKFSHSLHVYELKKPPILGWLDQFLPIKLTPLFRYFRSFLFATDVAFGREAEILDHPWYRSADIVQCHNLHGSYFRLSTLAKIAQSKKVFWTLHDMWAITGNCVYSDDPRVWREGISTKTRIMEYPPMLANRSLALWREKQAIYRQSPHLHLVTPSRWLAGRVRESILGDKALTVIPNGIDTTIFTPGNKITLRHKLNLPLDKKIVVFVAQGGDHDPRKGWEYIARLTQTHPDTLFLCIGGTRANVVGNIRYVANLIDPRALADYYRAADVFLFTSLAENFPLVVLEAMACGLPIVSFDVGGVSEQVVHQKNGYLAHYQDRDDLATGLDWVIGLPLAVHARIARANRERVQTNFSVAKMTSAYEHLFTS
jgi:glycosyltransferase involved in cell wall biosynthesis